MTTFEYSAESSLADGRSVRLNFISMSDTDDADRLCLYLAALPRLSGHLSGTIPDILDLIPDGPRKDAHYLAAEVEGRVVGAVTVFRDAPASQHGYHMAHVAQIQVDLLPDWQGLGVGEALVSGLVEWAKSQPGLRRLAFDTLSCNAWSIELLRQAGFVVEGRARASWHARTATGEVYLDRVNMGLLLDEDIIAVEEIAPPKDRAVGLTPEPVVTRDLSIPDVDCSPFFAELISQVRAFLPYELREFKTRETANEIHLLLEGLSKDVTFAVAFRLAAAEFDTPDMIEVGLHVRRDPDFNQAHVERLGEKLEELSAALGNKILYADVWREGWGRVALRLPYQPPDQVGAFMLAAQVAGFIQVLMPEAKAIAD